MLIGSKKQILYVRDTKSQIFREAYFILRTNQSSAEILDGDIVSECERIVDRTLPKLKHLSGIQRKKHKLDIFSFYTGLFIGSGVFFAAFMFFRFI